METVCLFSGGIVSFFAARRAFDRYAEHGRFRMLFTDTLIEDADLYRFLIEGAAAVVGRRLNWTPPRADEFPAQYLPAPHLGARPPMNPAWLVMLDELRERTAEAIPELAWIRDGRTPWDVFRKEKLIGSTRKDPCSKILKRHQSEKWLCENCAPESTRLIFGIHWEEAHRLEGEVWIERRKRRELRGVRPRYKALGWPIVEAPMCDAPWLTPADMSLELHSLGIEKPRLYRYGFAHNNCGGFCVKAGASHFARLLREMPDTFAAHEAEEAAFNSDRPGCVTQTVLAPEVDKPNGERGRVKMTLAEFRAARSEGRTFSLFDNTGCGCFLDDDEEEAA